MIKESDFMGEVIRKVSDFLNDHKVVVPKKYDNKKDFNSVIDNYSTDEVMEFSKSMFSGSKCEPSSILLSLDDSSVIGYNGLIDENRETGSTMKFVVGYLGLKLLGLNHDVNVYQWVIDRVTKINKNSFLDIYHKSGDVVSMSDAFSSGFPMSDNVLAYCIMVEIGFKYGGVSKPSNGEASDEVVQEAYFKGLGYANKELKNMGFENTNIVDAAGFNVDGHFDYNNNGYAKDFAGSTTRELALIVQKAFNDPLVAQAFTNQNIKYRSEALSSHPKVEELCNAYQIKYPDGFFKNNPDDGVYFIKSGTQGYSSAILGVVNNGEKYVYVINGVNALDRGGDYLAESLYEIDQGLGTNYFSNVNKYNYNS